MTKAPDYKGLFDHNGQLGIYSMMMRNNVNEGLAASELYNNNLCLLCEAIELQQNTNNNNICSDKNKRLDNKNTLIISTTNSIKKKHIYKRKKPCIFEGCTSLRRGGTKYCVRHGGKKYRSCCRYPGSCNSFPREKGLCQKHHTQYTKACYSIFTVDTR